MALLNFIFWIVFVTLCGATSEDTCQTENYIGECKGVSDCPYALRLLAKNEHRKLKDIFCGFNGTYPMTCCPKEHSLNTIAYKDTDETATNRPTSTHKPTEITTRAFRTTTKKIELEPDVLPNRSICGIFQGEDRIYGGDVADIDEFPWLARIKSVHPSGREAYFCSGSLITDQYVITAAHCLNFKVLSVRLGEWNTQAETDCHNEKCSDKVVDVDVDRVIPFPGKVNFTRGDIALLHLAQPVNFTDFVQPICLPTTEYTAMKDYERESIYVTAGWGITELESESVVKRKVNLDAVPMDICRVALPVIPEPSIPYVICAGGRKGVDSCRGDSGGPLVKLVQENYRINWFLYGITSLGPKNCGTEGIPGMYTRVTAYMDWIRRTVRT